MSHGGICGSLFRRRKAELSKEAFDKILDSTNSRGIIIED